MLMIISEKPENYKELGVQDNTIFIFTTDNGTASGRQIFNAEMPGEGVNTMAGIGRLSLCIAEWRYE